jgi:low affinity Fe/Cu permease
MTEHRHERDNGNRNGVTNGHERGSLAAAKHAFDQRKQEAARGGAGGGGDTPTVRHLFQRFAHATSVVVGTPWAFGVALLVVIIWAATGKLFGFSDTWQLVINTGTTIVTFLMVFLIQSTQNRDAKAIHLKLDELIRAKHGARNALVDLEHCTDEELDQIEQEFKRVRQRARPTANSERK